MKTTILSSIAVFTAVLLIVSCSREELDPKVSKSSISLTAPDYDYLAVSKNKGYLGRVLFYDKSLSVNNSISCASCHKQALAFSDTKRFSTGFENMETSRNTPPIQNLGGVSDITFPESEEPVLMWDGRENNLQEMVMSPVVNHIEMGMRSQEDLVNKLKEKAYYKTLFEQAYGDQNITFSRVSEALAGFTASIVSQNSKFDLNTFNGEQNFSTVENQGLQLFFGKYNCGSCHKLHNPVGYDEPTVSPLVNIGLDVEYEDQGQGALDGNPANNGKFKIPNLRNVALTAPYMHDGRFESLSEVIDHYSTGVKNNPNLDDRLKESGQPVVFNIPESDKAALIAFLHTLTDNRLITDPKYSDPFQ